MIIEVAVNGATTKARNPHVPISEDELVADAHACFDAGAAIVHHHIDRTGLSGAGRGRGVPRRVASRAARAPGRAVVPDDQHRPVGALVRPHHAAGRVGAAADEPQRPGLGQPRRAHRRRAERRLRVRQQLRRDRPPVRPVPRARARAEHRDLRARVPARRARLPRGRASCRPAASSSSTSAPTAASPARRSACRRRRGRSTPTWSCSTAPAWRGPSRPSAPTSRRSTSAAPRSTPAATCTSGWSSSAATASRRTSSSSRPP